MAGLALLILRIAVAAPLATSLSNVGPAWFYPAVIILVAALLGGLFARVAAAISAAVIGALSIGAGLPTGAAVALHSLSAVALAMLGPGAYSLDALLFGRRVIKLSE